MSPPSSLVTIVLWLAFSLPVSAAEQKKLDVKHPQRKFIGTRKDVPKSILDRTEKPSEKPRDVVVPEGDEAAVGGQAGDQRVS
jgi:hypothetical protein